MAEHPTYDSFILKTIMPAEGWQAVFVDNTRLRNHVVVPVHALALADRITRVKKDERVYRSPNRKPEGEDWEIVGVIYMPRHGWFVCDTQENYCGLLSPGMTLDEFQKESRCRGQHPLRE